MACWRDLGMPGIFRSRVTVIRMFMIPHHYFESDYFRDTGEALKEEAIKKGFRVELLF